MHGCKQCSSIIIIVGDPKFKMLQKSLGLFYDENKILHCKGRISNANLPHVTKFPAILPKDHHLTSLIIRQNHERVMCNGVKETLCSLRERSTGYLVDVKLSRGRYTSVMFVQS